MTAPRATWTDADTAWAQHAADTLARGSPLARFRQQPPFDSVRSTPAASAFAPPPERLLGRDVWSTARCGSAAAVTGFVAITDSTGSLRPFDVPRSAAAVGDSSGSAAAAAARCDDCDDAFDPMRTAKTFAAAAVATVDARDVRGGDGGGGTDAVGADRQSLPPPHGDSAACALCPRSAPPNVGGAGRVRDGQKGYSRQAQAFAPHEDDGVRGVTKSVVSLVGVRVAQLHVELRGPQGPSHTLWFARDTATGRLWIRAAQLDQALSDGGPKAYRRVVDALLLVAPWTVQKIRPRVTSPNGALNAAWYVRFSRAVVPFILDKCRPCDRPRAEALRALLLPADARADRDPSELPLPAACHPTDAFGNALGVGRAGPHRRRVIARVLPPPAESSESGAACSERLPAAGLHTFLGADRVSPPPPSPSPSSPPSSCDESDADWLRCHSPMSDSGTPSPSPSPVPLHSEPPLGWAPSPVSALSFSAPGRSPHSPPSALLRSYASARARSLSPFAFDDAAAADQR
jgi:hypothetical protein